MLKKILIANRGEIACRIARTARKLGIATVAVYSEPDRRAQHVMQADEAFALGGESAAESYLRAERIVEAALATGADAVHPGYGFLAENADFAESCKAAGLTFVGPPPAAIRAMGSKSEAKALMANAGVPVVPGYHGEAQDDATLEREAMEVGFPLLVKASAGGGGKGMRVVTEAAGLQAAIAGARREAGASFGDQRLLLERFVANGRHVEVQIFFDSAGNGVHLFERDCSVQRRYQKVLEEAPAPALSGAVREAMYSAALNAGRAVGYVGAGTVEMIAGADEFFFMEMNTRLQVEHPVTEMVTGVDLVEWQLRIASGEALPCAQDELRPRGHAVEVRLYAEDPARGFLPAVGTLSRLRFPAEDRSIRIDTGVAEGDTISIHYDPMVAKIIASAPDRRMALARLHQALAATQVAGVKTNAGFLHRLAQHPEVVAGGMDTGFLDREGEVLAAQPLPDDGPMLAAAAVLALREHTGTGASPWDAVDAWRMNHGYAEPIELVDAVGQESLVTYRREGDQRSLSLGPESVPVDFAASASDLVSIELSGRRESLGVHLDGQTLTLFRAGQTLTFQLIDRADVDADGGAHAGSLRAPMPGKVLATYVAPGDQVERGQPLMLMEAMKMEHTITAPADGTVSEVRYGENEQVDEGAELIVLAADA
ncbi:MAG: biotin carboxylase N-terminal domain-containing protein [Pseudomonadota bacterium]